MARLVADKLSPGKDSDGLLPLFKTCFFFTVATNNKEATQLHTSVATGELAFALGSSATAGPLQRANKLRFLAAAAPARVAAFPDVLEKFKSFGYEPSPRRRGRSSISSCE